MPSDNTPIAVMHPNATCTSSAPCFIPEPGADSYKNDEFERPTGQGAAGVNYQPSVDITTSQTGIDSNWLFYRINLFGVAPGSTPNASNSLPHFYGIEVNLDNDIEGDFIVEIAQPSQNVGTMRVKNCCMLV